MRVEEWSTEGAGREPFDWVFGYGSLIFRPTFPHHTTARATLRGWARRFFQGSEDHRGVPGAPGRVVTLRPATEGACVGLAFAVRAHDRDAVLEELDRREQGGYERLYVDLEIATRDRIERARALTYVAHAGNPWDLGEASATAIAAQIRGAVGPSGRNLDYLLDLARALRRLQIDDEHVEALVRIATLDGADARER
jgi:cation transport regulator ChaC